MQRYRLFSLLSVALGVVILAVFFYLVGVNSIIAALYLVPLWVFPLIFGLNLLSLFLYSLSWYLLVKTIGGNMSLWKCQTVSMASIFLFFVTPSGVFLEAARVFLASREGGLGIGESAATVIVHRILFTAAFLVSASFSFIMLLTSQAVPLQVATRLLGLFLGVVGVLAFVTLVTFRRSLLDKLASRALPRLATAIGRLTKQRSAAESGKELSQLVLHFEDAVRAIVRHRGHFALSFLVQVGYWFTVVMIMYTVSVGMGSGISVWAVALTIAVADFVQLAPVIIPGMIGVLESLLTGVLSGFGVPLSLAAAIAVLARIATYWVNIPITGLAAAYYASKYAMAALLKGGLAATPERLTAMI